MITTRKNSREFEADETAKSKDVIGGSSLKTKLSDFVRLGAPAALVTSDKGISSNAKDA